MLETPTDASIEILSENGIFVLKKLLSSSECSTLIEHAKLKTFNKAQKVHEGRNNEEFQSRLDNIDNAAVKTIISSVQKRVADCLGVDTGAVLLSSNWEFYRYYPAQYVSAHIDQSSRIKDDILSTMTMVIYLNDNFSGGGTYFDTEEITTQPTLGDCLIFTQQFSHAGLAVESGVKYILRNALALI
jgi:Rps23 Pro-64 3,4-dihydroxylase Tpa1-like proline 4-hydroxylase